MPRQVEIDRMLILFYRSNNAHDWTNYTRPYGWLNELPMKGLEEFVNVLNAVKEDIEREIADRKIKGHPRYPPAKYEGKSIN